MDYDSIIAQAAEAVKEPPKHIRATPNPKLVAHLDGDYMAYYHAGKDSTPAGQCRQSILARVRNVKRVTGATTVVVHLTCGSSNKGERYLIAETTPYQQQRKSSKRPRNWGICRDIMTDHDGPQFTPKVWKNREADDGIAYVTHATAEHRGLHVIHTADKDMRMFAGIHLNWNTWDQTVVPYGAYEVWGEDGLLYGHKWFWQQMIQGDTADHIPGLPRQGEVAATAALAGTTCNADAYAAVAALYARRMGEGWESYLCEQAALLWMRVDRHADVLDFLRLGVFPHNVQEAAWHMADRVRLKREQLEKLKC